MIHGYSTFWTRKPHNLVLYMIVNLDKKITGQYNTVVGKQQHTSKWLWLCCRCGSHDHFGVNPKGRDDSLSCTNCKVISSFQFCFPKLNSISKTIRKIHLAFMDRFSPGIRVNKRVFFFNCYLLQSFHFATPLQLKVVFQMLPFNLHSPFKVSMLLPTADSVYSLRISVLLFTDNSTLTLLSTGCSKALLLIATLADRSLSNCAGKHMQSIILWLSTADMVIPVV